jgi:hypothetical protein
LSYSNILNLAPTELVLSGEKVWFPPDKIINNMRSYFVIFDDSLPDPPQMNSQIWFHRPTKTQCPICQLCYLPHQHRQHYCHDCKQWVHVSCIGEAIRSSSTHSPLDWEPTSNQGSIDNDWLADGWPAIFDDVLRGPTVCGHHGNYDVDNNWLNTESGVQKGLIAMWREEGEYPEDWLRRFGECFLEDFLVGKSWKFFACPQCSQSM